MMRVDLWVIGLKSQQENILRIIFWFDDKKFLRNN